MMQLAAGATAQPRRASHVRLWMVVALISVPVLAWAAWWGSKHVMWWTPAGQHIGRVVREAASVNEDLLTPPQAYRNTRITPGELAALSHTAQRKLGGYYTGAALAKGRDVASR